MNAIRIILIGLTLQTGVSAEAAVDQISRYPALRGQKILFVTRPQYALDHHSTATLFQTGEINAGKFRGGSALKVIDFANGGRVSTLLTSPDGVIRDPEVSYDGKRIVFAMRKNKTDDYHIYEIHADGGKLRQLTFGEAVSDIDPVYLPDGTIVFSSTRDYKFCQCNRHIMANLFRMDADGANVHRIGGNTLFEGHAHVMPDGSILYDRWEYVDRQFGPSFGLWTVNPDGTNHALFYGNNAWSPGMIADARMMPGGHRFVATLGSCHDLPWGAIAIIDRTRGMDGPGPVLRSWPVDISAHLNKTDLLDPDHRHAGRIDAFRRLEIKYEDPYPLTDRYLLVSRMIGGDDKSMGLFLLDAQGDEMLIHREAPGCFDPMPLAPRFKPGVLADRMDHAEEVGRFYVLDVYRGTGMERVPRGTIKSLRVVEAPPKVQWTQPNWNIDATQAPAMNWNSTNNKRILGTAPVEKDGSAYFEAPADRFIYFQALDADGQMVQSMRSGTMIRPGETVGCVGCHDRRQDAAPVTSNYPLAMRRPASKLKPWYGPPRDFNYLTEVQPVFDRHCVSCHDYGKPDGDGLNLAGDVGLVFNTSYLDLRSKSPVRWQPDRPGQADPLVRAVDDGPPQVLGPYAWGSHRSRLIELIRDGHYDVKLSAEDFDRLVTWIDLNAPYYGSYASAYPGNLFGRSPLSNAQIARLSKLTGVPLGKSERHGSQVSFTRPEMSRCLSSLKGPDDPNYLEALAIIEAGQKQLTQRPRADMPGFIPSDIDRARQKYADQLRDIDRMVQRAIDRSQRIYPFRRGATSNPSAEAPFEEDRDE